MGGIQTCKVRNCRCFADSVDLTNKAHSHTPKVEMHTRQEIMPFWPPRYESEAISSKKLRPPGSSVHKKLLKKKRSRSHKDKLQKENCLFQINRSLITSMGGNFS